jgi:hypothetical protein
MEENIKSSDEYNTHLPNMPVYEQEALKQNIPLNQFLVDKVGLHDEVAEVLIANWNSNNIETGLSDSIENDSLEKENTNMKKSEKLLIGYFILSIIWNLYAATFPFWHNYYHSKSTELIVGVLSRYGIEILLYVLCIKHIVTPKINSKRIILYCYCPLYIMSVLNCNNGLSDGNTTMGSIIGSSIIMFIWYSILYLPVRRMKRQDKYHDRITVTPQKISFFYKLYLWFTLIIFGSVFYELYFLNEAGIFEYIDIPFTIFGLIGLFGYVYKKAIFNITIWKWYFFIIIIWDIVYTIFLFDTHITQDLSLGVKTGIFIFGFALFLPYYVALYLYGYKSDCVWNNQST